MYMYMYIYMYNVCARAAARRAESGFSTPVARIP